MQRPRPQPQEEKLEEPVSAPPVPFEKVIPQHTAYGSCTAVVALSLSIVFRSRKPMCIL